MTEEQFSELKEMIRDTDKKVTGIYANLFGVEGHGGINSRVEKLEEHRDEMKTVMAKVFGALIVVGSVASFIGAKIAHWFKIDTTP